MRQLVAGRKQTIAPGAYAPGMIVLVGPLAKNTTKKTIITR